MKNQNLENQSPENQELEQFLQQKNIRHQFGASIKPYLTMGIGGRVRLIIEVSEELQLKELLCYLHQKSHKYILLGGGSNVVFPDGFCDLAVVINRVSETSGTGCISNEGGNLVRVSSGVFISHLMEWCIRYNMGGMDFLAGIPGTLGGAAAVNAGAFGQSISTILEKAEIITPNGQVKTVDNHYFAFTYRNSRFKYTQDITQDITQDMDQDIILSVYLRYVEAPGEEVREKVEAKTRYRNQNHPGADNGSAGGSAGCFFKNPVIQGQKISAGGLIDQAGFKGTAHKTLNVSAAHANFIVNRGDARFDDVQELEKKIIEKVYQENGIKLEREVIFISPLGKKY